VLCVCVCCKLLSLMPSRSLQSPSNGVAVRRTRCCGWNATRPPNSSNQHVLPWTLATAAVAAAVSRSHWPAAAPRFSLQRITVIAPPPSRSSAHQLRPSIYPCGRSLGLQNLESLRRTPKRAATRLFSNGWPLSVGHTVRSYQPWRPRDNALRQLQLYSWLATDPFDGRGRRKYGILDWPNYGERPDSIVRSILLIL